MKRPAVLIVGAAAGALLVAAIGASAHTAIFVSKTGGVQSALLGDESSSTRVETPEPTEKPAAQKTPEPTETPEPADNDTETNDTETNDTETKAPEPPDTETGNHDGDHKNGSGGGHGD